MAYQLINLQDYATFNSIEEMDNTVRQYNASLTKTHYETLNLLKQYSCIVIGVSHIKIKTIAKSLDKSVRTIKRHLKALQEKGYISVINLMRIKTGGKGANAYVINPVEVQQEIINDTSQVSPRDVEEHNRQHQSHQAMTFAKVKKQTISSFKLLKSYLSNKRRKKSIKLKRTENIKSFRACPEVVPLELYEKYKPFFSDAQIKGLYNAITSQIQKHGNITDENYTIIVETCFNSLIKKLRKYHRNEGNKVRNIFAYVTQIAKTLSYRQYHMNMWNQENYIDNQPSEFKQISLQMWGITD
ncbi:replication/maintenance protein RepL [Staphylococcus caledonicus]|uniref:replication/maintenance protein RepL n=1 Tax=Staphylococcus caledonicus TaxID=2741333 RepID=UPI0018E4D90C|nr:replication/maintenance protein RepL [Staphylococcus caledonicus]MBI5973945.1 replication/maintenance protein RepL [Staphylococcus caledonicus]